MYTHMELIAGAQHLGLELAEVGFRTALAEDLGRNLAQGLVLDSLEEARARIRDWLDQRAVGIPEAREEIADRLDRAWRRGIEIARRGKGRAA
jgi:hypothetical protein